MVAALNNTDRDTLEELRVANADMLEMLEGVAECAIDGLDQWPNKDGTRTLWDEVIDVIARHKAKEKKDG